MVKRPTGITIIGMLYIALAILSLLWSGLVFGMGGLTSLFGGLFGAGNVAALGTSGAWAGFLGILVAAVQIVVAVGLLSMRKWAWVLALIGAALTVAEGIVAMFGGGPFALMCGSLGLIVPVVILVYLLRGSVRRAFGMENV